MHNLSPTGICSVLTLTRLLKQSRNVSRRSKKFWFLLSQRLILDPLPVATNLSLSLLPHPPLVIATLATMTIRTSSLLDNRPFVTAGPPNLLAVVEAVALPDPTNAPSPVAGNISRYPENWNSISRNSFISNTINVGYKIQFVHSPRLPPSIRCSNLSSKKFLTLNDQVQTLLRSGAISQVKYSEDLLLSRIFTVKKANGKDRMILDLSELNKQIVKVSFKMETVDHIKSLIRRGDYMNSIDLSDAFFSVNLHPSCKKYVSFEFNHVCYSFNVLPFGMTSSPRIFSKVLKPAIIWLRSQGLKISFYLDDIFIAADSIQLLSSHTSLTLKLLTFLGFFPNYSKSSLIPSQTLIHLGYVWNSSSLSIHLPSEKLDKTRNFAFKLLNRQHSLRDISSFLGKVISHSSAFKYAPLHYRRLQLEYCKLVGGNIPWDSTIVLSNESYDDIKWWAHCPNNLPPLSLTPPDPQISLYTDASNTGWGCILSSGESASGSWSSEDSSQHINFLELKSVYLSLVFFLHIIKNSSIMIFSDNSTTVFYINRVGGTHSDNLCSLALELWSFLEKHNIQCLAKHIPGLLNNEADMHSRLFSTRHEYGLNQHAFNQLFSLLNFIPSIDLFASSSNHKLTPYVSWLPDTTASYQDAFSFSWPPFSYAFPPIPLINRVVQKAISDNVKDLILITPAWPGLISLPLILPLISSDPIFIPSSYITGPLPTRYRFPVVAWHICISVASPTIFQAKLYPPSPTASEIPPFKATCDSGENFTRLLQLKGIKINFPFP